MPAERKHNSFRKCQQEILKHPKDYLRWRVSSGVNKMVHLKEGNEITAGKKRTKEKQLTKGCVQIERLRRARWNSQLTSLCFLAIITTGTSIPAPREGELSVSDELILCVEAEVVTSVISSALLYLWTQLLHNSQQLRLILSSRSRRTSTAAAWMSSGSFAVAARRLMRR